MMTPRDPTIYPETDEMGEGELQRLICELLRPLLARFLAERSPGDVHVGSNQFLYYEKHNSAARIAPDVYVLPDVPQTRVARSWKLWEVPPPSFCLEVVSTVVAKDYAASPALNELAGTRELVIFDPEHEGDARWLWQVWRRDRRGALELVEQTNHDRVHAVTLGCYLRRTGNGGETRVRLATGFGGRDLVPTDAERAAREAQRAAREAQRAAHEAVRAAHEAERAAHEAERAKREAERADAAERRVRELEAKLGRTREK